MFSRPPLDKYRSITLQAVGYMDEKKTIQMTLNCRLLIIYFSSLPHEK